jgi:mannosyltransferase OCH1-like enzyme
MIQKTIHYCWFGGNPLPKKAKKCLKSWEKYFPAHEIKEWNETNYDVNKIPYTESAYAAGKYAFVSDYARFDILYQYGGLYFDTDVEVIKPFDAVLDDGPFLGMETAGRINPGIGCAINTGESVVKEILETYRILDYSNAVKNNITVVDISTDIFTRYGFQNNNSIQKVGGITIYPTEYFNPIDFDTHYLHKTVNTLSIHHGDASWVDGKRRTTAFLHRWLCRIFGKKTGAFLSGKIRKASKNIYQYFVINEE